MAIPTCILRILLVAALAAPVAPTLRAEDVPPVQGVDVIQAVKDLKAAVGPLPEAKAGKGKPWEQAIAGITDPRPDVHNEAMAALIRRGTEVLPDLGVLANDPDWQVRVRVATVAASIGGDDGTKLVLGISHDPDRRVRELSALLLGRARGAGAFARLGELLRASEPDIRQSAARGLGLLGDPQGLAVLCGYGRESDDLVRRDERASLGALVMQAAAVPPLAGLIGERRGLEQLALIEVSEMVGDPRLCPALTAVLAAPGSTAVAAAAARSLGANGDSRALEVLCRAAAADGSGDELRTAAAETLRQLTGYAAGAGHAWDLWWRDHGAEVQALVFRDQFIAACHDPAHVATRAELAGFTTAQLMPLVEGALGNGSPWWPARAWAVLAADDAARWTQPLLARINAVADARARLGLIILLDQLGDPGAAEGLRKLLDKPQGAALPQLLSDGPERVAVRIALERRH